jgi:hypothetical protein
MAQSNHHHLPAEAWSPWGNQGRLARTGIAHSCELGGSSEKRISHSLPSFRLMPAEKTRLSRCDRRTIMTEGNKEMYLPTACVGVRGAGFRLQV